MREQGSGHILQVSSIGGVNAFPVLGLYHASKWGLEAFSQSLAAEVKDFGIKVTIIEPAGYSTDWRGASAVVADENPVYDDVRAARATLFSGPLAEPGDPQATGSAILELVDADEPPLRVFLGSGTLDMIRAEYERRLENWERWDGLANAAQGGVASVAGLRQFTLGSDVRGPCGFASIAPMPCIFKLIVDLILGPEEQVAYISVTTR